MIACLSIPAMVATASPDFPMSLNGGVIINGADAPAGTIIEAKEGDKSLGTTTVQVDGVYGNSGNNKLPVSKPDGTSVDIYVKLPTMSSSVKVASTTWDNDKVFDINANIGTDTGSDGGSTSGGGGMGGAATESETPSGAETVTNTKEDTNTNEPTSTQSLREGIEDTVFQTREAAQDNTILPSILGIGLLAMLLLGYMKYKEA